MKDRYGREITYMRLSVTDQCNLRCQYCMPEEGIHHKKQEEILTEEEMIMAVEAATALGIQKIRITGGEPLVKKNIISICKKIASVRGICDLCLTTNGILLSEMAQPLRDAGVNRVNISLDTLNSEKYTCITRGGTLLDVQKGFHAALLAGFDQIKINVVLMAGFNEDEIRDFAELTVKYPIEVRFIEVMPMLGEAKKLEQHFLPCSAVLETLIDAVPQDMDENVARKYRLPGAQGTIGLISAMSQRFCSKCNRIRLTADGKLKPCLHSAQEFSIKGMQVEDMKEQMCRTISAKPEHHNMMIDGEGSLAGRNMNQIGG